MAQDNDTKQSPVSKIPVFLAGAGLGLIACYMLDPQHGKSRRAKVMGKSSKHIESGWRALFHRVTGFFQEFTHRGPSMAEVADALKDPKAVPAVKKAVETVDQISH